MRGVFSQINSLLKAPLSSSPFDIFLIVGLVIVAIFLWTRVLRAFEDIA